MTELQAFRIEQLTAARQISDDRLIAAARRIRPTFRLLAELNVTESDALIQDLEASSGSGRTRSIIFTPPNVEASAPAEQPRVDDVLILGELIRDAKTIDEKLRKLPFADESYRGDLRVVMSAAIRIVEKSKKLLGEEGSVQ